MNAEFIRRRCRRARICWARALLCFLVFGLGFGWPMIVEYGLLRSRLPCHCAGSSGACAVLDSVSIVMDTSPKTNVSYELFIGSLGIFSLLLLVCYFLPLDAPSKDVAYIINNFIALIFLFDFFYGWWNTPGKLGYLKTGWLTLLGGIPFAPLLALFRIWRVTNLIRYMHATGQRRFFRTLLHAPATSVLLSTLFLAIVVVTISSMFVVSYEVKSPSSNIKTGADALWWSLVTVSTVGFGDRYPVTTGGRLIGVAIMVVGVGLFGVLSSFLASKFIRNQQAGDLDTKNEIAALREQIASMQRSIDWLMPQTPANQNAFTDEPQNGEPI